MLVWLVACVALDPAPVDDDGDGWSVARDCDDRAAEVYPYAPELCDEIDNDCDGEVDEDVVDLYADLDGDGVGAGEPVAHCEVASGWSRWGTDCDDADPAVYPGQAEVPYNGIDDDCLASTADADLDGDGVDAPADCDDDDATVTTERVFGDEHLGSAEDVAEVCRGSCPARFGDLRLGGTLGDAAGLECVVEVSGELSLENGLTSLAGLSGLTEVGALMVTSESLGSLVGLEAITSVDTLAVLDPSALVSFDGLDGLVYASEIYVEPTFSSLDGLGSLTSVGDLTLTVAAANAVQFPALESLGTASVTSEGACVAFPRLTSVTADLRSNGCTSWPALEEMSGTLTLWYLGDGSFGALRVLAALKSDAADAEPLAGLPVLERLEGELELSPAVAGTVVTLPGSLRWIGTLTVDLDNLEALDAPDALVVDHVRLSGSDASTAEALGGLRVASVVGNGAQVDSLLGLTADDGVLALELWGQGRHLGGIAGLLELDALTLESARAADLDGLAGLTHIAGDVTLDSNYLLTSLEGLSSVDSIGGDVLIQRNFSLGDEAAWAWVDTVGLSNIGGVVTIADNQM